MSDLLQRAIEIFAELCDQSRSEQARRLALLEDDDPALRAEVQELLLGDREPDARLERRAEDIVAWQTIMLEGGSEPVPEEVIERLTDRGRSLVRYREEHEVGRGGMGAVYQVWDEDLERKVAMKVLGSGKAAHSSVGPRRLQRFLDEARVTGQLDHPGILPVHDLGIDSQGRAYFTMKFVKGQTLKDVFAAVARGDGEWTQTRALGVLQRVCEAMSYAHAKGVVHRDLKPSNIMVGRFGEVYVMDWGVARLRSRRDGLDLRPKRPMPEGAPTGEIAIDSPVVTMDGTVVGTPYFMSPEQARGGWVDDRSDVYAIGAMLYTLVSGSPPYGDDSRTSTPHDVLERVIEGPPPPLRGRHTAPAELEAIYEKAMARAAENRYASVADLAEDLRAYLEGRVVSAHRTGALIELRKWMARNRALAASMAAGVLILLAGLVASLILTNSAETQRRIAVESEADANQERTKALRLSNQMTLGFLLEAGDDLWPAHPENLEAYEFFLDKANEAMTHSTDVIELAALRERALPRSAEERERERRTHPRFGELQQLEIRIGSARHAAAVRAGRAEPLDFPLDEASLPEDARLLNEQAWKLVRPVEEGVDPVLREFGREAEGLSLAKLAAMYVTDDQLLPDVCDTLAWAFFANGLDDEALIESTAAVEAASPARREGFEEGRESLRAAIEASNTGEDLLELEASLASLDAEVSKRRSWVFDSLEAHYRHELLTFLVETSEALADPDDGMLRGVSAEHGWGIERRKAWAERVEDLTLTGREAARRWRHAIASIADERTCPQYEGLVIEPQPGLIPIGMDRISGLWEFAHPQTGSVPSRAEDGRLQIDAESGLVFVLLPGGAFWMGAQASDPARPNYDQKARPSEGPLHEVTLSPFFLSKYEMTQAQWMRLTGNNPSFYSPEYMNGGLGTSFTHPVERVSWYDCVKVCSWLGMTLCTEAQWEYAARGGSTTIYWTGNDRDSLRYDVNLADRAARRVRAPWPQIDDWPDLDDGYPVHAPVDTYTPNAFGLHNVHGNVWEWCRDAYLANAYDRRTEQDPVHELIDTENVVSRGGGFRSQSSSARSSYRQSNAPDTALSEVGLRPARALQWQ